MHYEQKQDLTLELTCEGGMNHVSYRVVSLE